MLERRNCVALASAAAFAIGCSSNVSPSDAGDAAVISDARMDGAAGDTSRDVVGMESLAEVGSDAPATDGGDATPGTARAAVLFGGNAGGMDMSDTWTWSGTAWFPATPTGTVPPAREQGAMASVRGGAVLFGGITGLVGGCNIVTFNDTWLWDGMGWSPLGSATPPPPRYQTAMATLGANVVLFGGISLGGPEMGDTWVLNVGQNAWTLASNTGPSPRHRAAMAALGNVVVLFGGGQFVDAEGGYEQYLGDTWLWDGTSWSPATPANHPSPREGHTMATFGNQVILYGGFDDTGTVADTWAWDGTSWTPVAMSLPTARTDAVITDAPGGLVLFGGLDMSGFLLSDTWTWNGSAWTSVGGPTPSARTDYAMASLY